MDKSVVSYCATFFFNKSDYSLYYDIVFVFKLWQLHFSL